MKQKKALGYIVGIIIILAVVVYVVAKTHKTAAPNLTSNSVTPTPVSTVPVTVPPTQIPSGLPSDLPLEAGAKVLQNFQANLPNSKQVQSTRVYVSAKTPDQNYNIFQKYLTGNGWMPSSNLNQTNIKTLNAVKGSASLDITIAKDAKGQVTVNVTYIN